MDPKTIQKAADAASSKAKAPTIQDMIKTMAPAIKAALPSVITPERFSRIVLSAISTNPNLARCNPRTFLSAMMTAAQLGLEPNTPLGQAYLIPRKCKVRLPDGKWGEEEQCQFQLGYRGLIDLAFRSGQVASIQAEVVRENDEFQYELGLDAKLRHVPASGDRGAVTHVYAILRTKDGAVMSKCVPAADIDAFAQRKSVAYNKGPWQSDWEEMAKKTVLKSLLKYAPLKTEFVRGVVQDGAVRNEINAEMASLPMLEAAAEDEAPAQIAAGSATQPEEVEVEVVQKETAKA